MRKLLLMALILSLVSLTGCVIELGDGIDIDLGDGIGITKGAVKTGEMKTFEEVIELGDQKEIDVDLNLGAARIDVSKTEDNLFEGKVETDIVGLEPKMELKGERLSIRDDFSYNSVKRFTNDWNIKLTNKVPIRLDASVNASRSNFDLSGMMIRDIEMHYNASNANVVFNEKNPEDFKNFELDVNAGNVEVVGLDNAAPGDMDIEVNAGSVALEFGDNIDKNIEISIKGNASKTTIVLPDNVGISIERKSNLISLNLEKSGFSNSEDFYKSENYDSAEFKVDIEINGTASSVTVK